MTMNTIEIVFSIYGMIAIALVLIALKKIDTDNKRIKERMLEEVAKHGHWRLDGTCSVCGMHSLQTYGNFCCYCGSDMRERKEGSK